MDTVFSPPRPKVGSRGIEGRSRETVGRSRYRTVLSPKVTIGSQFLRNLVYPKVLGSLVRVLLGGRGGNRDGRSALEVRDGVASLSANLHSGPVEIPLAFSIGFGEYSVQQVFVGSVEGNGRKRKHLLQSFFWTRGSQVREGTNFMENGFRCFGFCPFVCLFVCWSFRQPLVQRYCRVFTRQHPTKVKGCSFWKGKEWLSCCRLTES